jgi:hypothetical protein
LPTSHAGFTVVNATGSPLYVGQAGTAECVLLPPGVALPYLLVARSRPSALRVAAAAPGGSGPGTWCQPVPLDVEGVCVRRLQSVCVRACALRPAARVCVREGVGMGVVAARVYF